MSLAPAWCASKAWMALRTATAMAIVQTRKIPFVSSLLNIAQANANRAPIEPVGMSNDSEGGRTPRLLVYDFGVTFSIEKSAGAWFRFCRFRRGGLIRD